MPRPLQIAVLALGLALLVLPTTAMVVPWATERPLQGAIVPAERPPLRLEGLWSEKYQKGLTAWFEQRYGLRATATRFDNSLSYYVLGETRPEKPVKVGRERVLFLDEHVFFHNRRDTPHAQSAKMARLARMAQAALAARGKAMVFVVLPAKPTYYPDAFPRGWSLPLGRERPCDAAVVRPFIEAFEREGVIFVDGRAVIAAEGLERELVYPRTGRHLAAPAVCPILERALSRAREILVDAELPPLDCRYARAVPASLWDEEFDLLRLLNVWGAKPEAVAQMVKVEERLPRERRVDTLVVGSSFSWRIIYEAQRNHALGDITLLYYNRSVAAHGDSEPSDPVPRPGSEAWRRLVLDKKLFLLPLPEEYLPLHNADFLLQVVDALGLDPGDLRELAA